MNEIPEAPVKRVGGAEDGIGRGAGKRDDRTRLLQHADYLDRIGRRSLAAALRRVVYDATWSGPHATDEMPRVREVRLPQPDEVHATGNELLVELDDECEQNDGSVRGGRDG